MKDTILSLLTKQRDALEKINYQSVSDGWNRFYRGKVEAYNEAIKLIYENCDDKAATVVHIKTR